MINIKIFTLFPEIFKDYLNTSILGKALEKKLWDYQIINIRDYSTEKHKKVDDIPFGGGCGMIMQAEPLANAIDANCDIKNTKFYYMSPRGEVFTQQKVKDIIQNKEIAIICVRYEGLDQRVIDEYDMEEISIGDFVLTGGELPALTLIDCCIRCIDGVLGNNNSLNDESFGGLEESKNNFLLEYPLYTQPRVWRNREVPEVLTSGNHKNIADWKLQKAKEITEERRKDLWEKFTNYKSNK
ncbi:MAG TPA: tRNA (guanosine(37)-N1)-methyltransferase TrmD [Rickettsiales bacterium]|nr:tRNA (guanosine(37)-N1)-methyltransferase TrmD [Rickettsiales bacterium]